MEALSFMKFWLSGASGKARREIRISETPTAFGELCEGDDSFFELEISLSDFSPKETKTPEDKHTFSVSKSKVLPLVDITWKSGQKFRAFSFNKSKSVEPEKSRSLNARFRNEDYETSTASSPLSSSSPSNRFFSLMKPLYTKKQSVSASPSGKSRSASAVMSPAKRVDESLQDGIQSAILHCKKSFHGSRESSLSSESSSQHKLSTCSSEDSFIFSRIGSDSMSEESIDSLTSIKDQQEEIMPN